MAMGVCSNGIRRLASTAAATAWSGGNSPVRASDDHLFLMTDDDDSLNASPHLDLMKVPGAEVWRFG